MLRYPGTDFSCRQGHRETCRRSVISWCFQSRDLLHELCSLDRNESDSSSTRSTPTILSVRWTNGNLTLLHQRSIIDVCRCTQYLWSPWSSDSSSWKPTSARLCTLCLCQSIDSKLSGTRKKVSTNSDATSSSQFHSSRGLGHSICHARSCAFCSAGCLSPAVSCSSRSTFA